MHWPCGRAVPLAEQDPAITALQQVHVGAVEHRAQQRFDGLGKRDDAGFSLLRQRDARRLGECGGAGAGCNDYAIGIQCLAVCLDTDPATTP